MDTTFFIAAKILGALLRAETWMVLALAVTVLALLLDRRRLALGVSAAGLMFLLLLTVLPLGHYVLAPLERSYPAGLSLRHVDGIIVLGGAEDAAASAHWGQTQINAAGERFTAALALARRFPAARVVFTGGSGALRDLTGADLSEAEAARRFFVEQGLDPARLVLEGASRNTAENAMLSLKVVRPQLDEVFVLVTSAFHMPRAVRSFEAAGWPALAPYPVDFRTSTFANGVGWNLAANLEALNIATKEHVGYLAYELAGP